MEEEVMKSALITGINGQDGSYLAELLLEKGYEVYGIMRRKSVVDYGNVEHIKDKIHFIYADMTDVISLINAMKISQADEVYNLSLIHICFWYILGRLRKVRGYFIGV